MVGWVDGLWNVISEVNLLLTAPGKWTLYIHMSVKPFEQQGRGYTGRILVFGKWSSIVWILHDHVLVSQR